MASLGLKIYYLRTREKKINQKEVADALGVRQATISYIENDVTSPQWALLVRLCRFFDVTPTFLADEKRGVVPLLTERWGLRNSLVTMGMWVESSKDATQRLGDGELLCRVEPGAELYDDEAAEVRRRYKRKASALAALRKLRAEQAAEHKKLERELQQERDRHPRRRDH